RRASIAKDDERNLRRLGRSVEGSQRSARVAREAAPGKEPARSPSRRTNPVTSQSWRRRRAPRKEKYYGTQRKTLLWLPRGRRGSVRRRGCAGRSTEQIRRPSA